MDEGAGDRGGGRREGSTATRALLVDVAARLLREHGSGGVTTRAVAEAAQVRAPTIYRCFGDKDGLLDAVAEREVSDFVARKAAVAASASASEQDPVEDLRAGWDTYVDFGLSHPALFSLLTDPHRPGPSPAAASGLDVLRGRVHRIAAAGRLRVSESRAALMVHAAGTGAVLTLLATPASERDDHLADATWDALCRAILTDAPALEEIAGTEVLASAVALRAAAPELPGLSDVERALLAEWLDRTVTALQQPPGAPERAHP